MSFDATTIVTAAGLQIISLPSTNATDPHVPGVVSTPASSVISMTDKTDIVISLAILLCLAMLAIAVVAFIAVLSFMKVQTERKKNTLVHYSEVSLRGNSRASGIRGENFDSIFMKVNTAYVSHKRSREYIKNNTSSSEGTAYYDNDLDYEYMN